MMLIKPFEKIDLASLGALQPEGWTIGHAFDFYTSSHFCFPVKIMIGHEMVGVGSTIIHDDAAWLAHIIVHPGHRNKGIGRLITETLIDSLKNTSCDTTYLIATDLGAPVYEKLGFKTETEYLFFKDIKTTQTTASENIVPYQNLFKAQITQLDRSTSAEDRMAHLEQYFSDACIYLKNNSVQGYYLPGFNEGLIIAKNAEAGIDLMKSRLMTKNNAVIPADNAAAINFLHQQGCAAFKSAKRMRLGKQREIDLSMMYNRISGSMG